MNYLTFARMRLPAPAYRQAGLAGSGAVHHWYHISRARITVAPFGRRLGAAAYTLLTVVFVFLCRRARWLA